MDITVNAINLKGLDYGENDKLCTLYSAQNGKITVILKGVKKAAAKLKFAAMPFCFGEYSLSKSNSRYIVTGCTSDFIFFDISADIDKYYTGCCILECVDQMGVEDVKNPNLFLLTLNVLKTLSFEEAEKSDLYKILIKFFLEALRLSGYKLNLEKCVNCNAALKETLFFLPESGGFTCNLCRHGVKTTFLIYTSLRLIDITDFEQLKTLILDEQALKNVLKLLKGYLGYLGYHLKVIDRLVN